MRPYGVALEDHPHAPLFRRYEGFPAGNQLFVDVQLSGAGLLESRDHAQHGRFSASRRTEQGDELPVPEHGVKVLQHRILSETLRHMPDRYRRHPLRPFILRFYIENSPFVSLFSTKFSPITISRIPKAIAQLMGWLVNVQYSYSWYPIVFVVLEYSSVVIDSS